MYIRRTSVPENLENSNGYCARLDMRLDERIKVRAEKASALPGMKNMTGHVIKLMDNDATQLIAEHDNITVDDNIFDRFMSACEKAQQPNDVLLEASVFTKNEKGDKYHIDGLF